MEDIEHTGLLIDYPELSSHLLSTSRYYQKQYLSSVCHLPLSTNELLKVIVNPQLQKSDVFYFYKTDVNNKQMLKTFNYLKYSTDNIFIKPIEAIITPPSYSVRGLMGSRKTLQDIQFHYHPDILFVTIDIIGLYHAYKNRTSCLIQPRYAHDKTLKEFHKIVDYLVDNEQLIQLNLYLLRNASILNMATVNDINQIMKNNKEYDDYILSTEPWRIKMLTMIVTKINQFK